MNPNISYYKKAENHKYSRIDLNIALGPNSCTIIPSWFFPPVSLCEWDCIFLSFCDLQLAPTFIWQKADKVARMLICVGRVQLHRVWRNEFKNINHVFSPQCLPPKPKQMLYNSFSQSILKQLWTWTVYSVSNLHNTNVTIFFVDP